MTSFQSRNPIPIGIVSLVVLSLVALSAYYVDELPIIGGGTSYQAYFSEAAGLRTSDEVRIAGVKAGEVSDVALDGARVLVTFRVQDAWVGDRSSASIQIKTLLGAKYVALDPRGDEVLDPDQPIPLSRTVAPFDVVEAFNGLSETVGDIDTDQLGRSFQTLADTFRGTPEEARGALDGLSRLSGTIASRDEQLATLLDGTDNVSGVLADRDQEFERLLRDGNLLLAELDRRREAISALLTSTQRLSTELRGLVAENREQLRPALEALDRVAATLQRNQDDLDRGIEQLAPFVRLFNNTLSNGRWFDNFVCNLVPPREGPINSEGCYARGN
ncbi:MAG: MCE family protein [Pseudonocardiaceae bacterium]|nr:MCE family protein [Pseudonocardiaceae bacterium]